MLWMQAYTAPHKPSISKANGSLTCQPLLTNALFAAIDQLLLVARAGAPHLRAFCAFLSLPVVLTLLCFLHPPHISPPFIMSGLLRLPLPCPSMMALASLLLPFLWAFSLPVPPSPVPRLLLSLALLPCPLSHLCLSALLPVLFHPRNVQVNLLFNYPTSLLPLPLSPLFCTMRVNLHSSLVKSPLPLPHSTPFSTMLLRRFRPICLQCRVATPFPHVFHPCPRLKLSLVLLSRMLLSHLHLSIATFPLLLLCLAPAPRDACLQTLLDKVDLP